MEFKKYESNLIPRSFFTTESCELDNEINDKILSIVEKKFGIVFSELEIPSFLFMDKDGFGFMSFTFNPKDTSFSPSGRMTSSGKESFTIYEATFSFDDLYNG